MSSEQALVPFEASAGIDSSSVLVLAPHPDDEVFGCGGAIARHVAQGTALLVVVLTDGGAAGDAAVRADESRAAARVLGCAEPEFWGQADRHLAAGADLVQRLVACIEARGVDLVYVPSPQEVHPDHRQTWALVCAAAERLARPVRVACYEVGNPLPRPNLLLDITPVLEAKRAAVACFATQTARQDYAEQLAGLGRYRSYMLPRAVRAAEAFCVLQSADLARPLGVDGAVAEATTWGWLADPSTASRWRAPPKVSVVVRSLGRPLLHEALDSVARQTWPNIEVVVVAAGATHPPLPARCGPFPLRLVQQGPLARSRAANTGLEHASGDHVLFLDDDDWLLPAHVARLAGALHGQRLWRAAYTGVAMVDAESRPIGQTFDLPFDPLRQRAGNLTPIHAVLFERALFLEGCRFDENLDRYEDWDFWLQVAARTAMAHVPGVSAAYRIHPSSGVHEDAGVTSASTQTIHDKWAAAWSDGQKQELMRRAWAFDEQGAELATLAQALAVTEDRLRQVEAQEHEARHTAALAQESQAILHASLLALQVEHGALRHEREVLQGRLADVEQRLAALAETYRAQGEQLAAEQSRRVALENQADQLINDLAAARQRAAGLQVDLQAMRASSSWRVTAPLRRAASLLQVLRRAVRPAGRAAVRQVLASGGLPALAARAAHRLARPPQDEGLDYAEWVRRFDTPDGWQLARWAALAGALPRRPLLSVLMPVFNPAPDELREAVASLQAQVYPHWELCAVDDASTDPQTAALLDELAAAEPRIRLQRRAENGHIAVASNDALALAGGEFVVLMDQDDVLAPQALLRIAQVLNSQPDVRLMYSDEDKLEAGVRADAYFKPDWNPTLFLGQNLVSHLGAYRRALLREVGGFRPGFEGSQDHDLALRCVERLTPGQIVHIPEVLYHWRVGPASTALAAGRKPYAAKAGQAAILEHGLRIGVPLRVDLTPDNGYDTRPDVDAPAGALTLLLVDAAATETARAELPADWEATNVGAIIGAVWRVPATREALNAALQDAPGDRVALVRAGLQPLAGDALLRLWQQAGLPQVGIASGAVWSADGRLTGSGLVLGPQGTAAVLCRGLARPHPGYLGRAALAQQLSAVALDACVLRREAVLACAGFDDAPGVASAVGLCLRLRAAGLSTVWCPPSAWRDPARFDTSAAAAQPVATAALQALALQHPQAFAADPAYHRALDAARADFSLDRLGPRRWSSDAHGPGR